MTLAEKAEQLRDTANALRPKIVPEYQSIAVPTSTDPAQLECIELPDVTEDVGPAEFIHLVKGSVSHPVARITPESILAEIETDALTFARRFVKMADALADALAVLRETQGTVDALLSHVNQIANFTNGLPRREEFDELREWVSNLSARVPV